MSWINRIGDVASTVGKGVGNFALDLVKSPVASARFAWDVATAPWNDDEEYNGFMNTMSSAWNKSGGTMVKPLANAGGAIMKVPGVRPVFEKLDEINRELIREPLATINLVQGDVAAGKASFFDPNEWKKAYQGSQSISYGQAYTYAMAKGISKANEALGIAQGLDYSKSVDLAIYDPKFNIYDPAQRDVAFKQSLMGKITSGTMDVTIQVVGDVTIVGGKVGKALKASKYAEGVIKTADDAAQAAEDITKAQYGVNNRFTKVLDDFTKNDSAYAISHPMIKSSSQPGLLAYMLGQSKTVDETSLILRSALSDPAAMDELAFVRADLTDALKAARGDLSAVDQYKMFYAADDSGMIPFMNDMPNVIKEAEENYKALASTDEYFSKLMQLGEGGGSLTRTSGYLSRGIENFVAESRALKYYDKTVGQAKVDVYQPTPFHRLYQKISWAAGERPAGIIDFNDADSYKEVVANISTVEKILGWSPAQSGKVLDNYLAAATPEARFKAALVFEESVFKSIASKFDIDEVTAQSIYNTYKGARQSGMQSMKDRGFMVDLDGSILKVQQLESQSANFLPLMDFALMNNLLKRNSSTIRKITGASKDVVLHYADVLQDAFKAGALLRLGYTQRNAIDSQLRILGAVGALGSIRYLGEGIKNVVYNTVKTPARLIDRYRSIDAGMTYSEIQADTTKLIKQISKLDDEIGALEAKASIRPDDAELAVELNTKRMLREEKLAVYNHNNGVLAKNSKMEPKKRIGTGTYEVVGSDGEKYILHDAFGGPLGDMFRRIASSQSAFERVVDSNSDLYARTVASKGIQAIRPTDKGYFEQWAQTLRNQFANSEVIRQINQGKSIDEITHWLVSSPAGRDLRKRLSLTSSDAQGYVTRISNFYDNYLPVTSNLRPQLAEITAETLRTTFKNPSDLPIIHGHLLEDAFFNKADGFIKKAINGTFKLLGTMPEDALARNPLYVTLYRREVSRRINVASGLKEEGRLTVAEQEKIMAAAHKIALREMKGILFNIERRSNLAAAFKYISPFFSAQENAYKTWLKIVANNPVIANRAYNVWQAPNRAGLVTDFEGNPVPPGETSGNDIIWVSLPKGLRNIPGLNSLTEMGIPKQSLDIIFQGGLDVAFNKGNPNLVSDIFPVGPYVAIPASELMKKQPSLENSLKMVLPYGSYNDALGIPSGSALLPAWLQKAQTLAAGQDDPQFARTWQLIWATEQIKAKRQGLPPVSDNEILKKTQDYWKMRMVANLVMPFAPQFNTPYKFYLDKSREYRRMYGVNADAKFLQDFPEFFDFTTTLSNNPTGIQSSQQAVANFNKYKGLVGDLVNIEPKLVGLLVNDPNGYEFSQAAYDYLYGTKISAGSKQTFLSAQDPAVAQKKTDAEKGWIQYNQFMDLIDTELQKRGLTSTQQKGAEDLAAIKSAVIQKLSVQTDAEGKPIYDEKTGTFARTAWYDDYLDSDGSKTNRVIAGFGIIFNNDKFREDNKNNPTWKSIKTYMELRKAIAAELVKRDVKSITAKKNADLKAIYDAVVQKLKNDDKLGFAYVYDRFLSQDLIYDKYLTPKEVK